MNIPESVLRDVYAKAAEGACTICNGGEEVDPQLFVFKIEEDKPVCVGVMPQEMTRMLHSSPGTKQVMMGVIDKLLSSTDDDAGPLRGDLVVHLCEAWRKECRSEAEVDELVNDGQSVEEMDGHDEVIIVNMHTSDRTYTGLMPITTDTGGNRHVAFVPLDMEAKTEGRLSRHQESN